MTYVSLSLCLFVCLIVCLLVFGNNKGSRLYVKHTCSHVLGDMAVTLHRNSACAHTDTLYM